MAMRKSIPWRIFIKNIFVKMDFPISLLVYPAALLLRIVRQSGVNRMPRSRQALIKVGVFPILDHYYEPQFNFQDEVVDFSKERALAGIDWNVEGQLALLSRFTFAKELRSFSQGESIPPTFGFGNDQFGRGDAEYWYSLIRLLKPKQIFEIGSGNSTLMAISAITKNSHEESGYVCRHVCIEPYEAPWLEASGVEVVRKRVEAVSLDFFGQLEDGDVLFIDSSHVIRPHGDVLFEFLQILPNLKPGVIVHIHDIFSPRNYPASWVVDDLKLWNEQYLLEAFLTENKNWKVLSSLNFLKHNYFSALNERLPMLLPETEPASFYIVKI